MKKASLLGASILALTLVSSPAGAVFLSVSSTQSTLGAFAQIIAAPTQVLDNAVTNLGQQGFNEQQGVVLSTALSTDQGVIAAGTRVNSHMIFFNKPTIHSGLDSHTGVTWTFAGTIIGTMSDSGGLLEAASNSQLGSLTTAYPGAFSARGLEGADALTVGGSQLTVDLDMFVAQPGDWMRVVTVVPEPGTIMILGFGLAMLGGGAIRRRRSRA